MVLWILLLLNVSILLNYLLLRISSILILRLICLVSGILLVSLHQSVPDLLPIVSSSIHVELPLSLHRYSGEVSTLL